MIPPGLQNGIFGSARDRFSTTPMTSFSYWLNMCLIDHV